VLSAGIRQIVGVWEILAPFGVDPAKIKGLLNTFQRSAWTK
jgi:hypothetical protein